MKKSRQLGVVCAHPLSLSNSLSAEQEVIPLVEKKRQIRSSSIRATTVLSATLLALQVFLIKPAIALTINIDYDYDGAAQSGAIGVFSSPGGTFWNSVSGNTSLLDEFGGSTSASVAQWSVTGFSGADVGTVPELFSDTMFVDGPTGGIDRHNIIGLTAGTLYEIAVYGGVLTNQWGSRAAIVHAGGTSASAEFGYVGTNAALPGTAGVEYVTFSGLTPLDFGGGIFGFTITTAAMTNSRLNMITGLEIRTVPVPSALWLFGSGLLGLVGVARRKART